MSSPVVRAAGGFTLFLVASYCFRKMRILNALAVVGIVYLLYDPQCIGYFVVQSKTWVDTAFDGDKEVNFP
jgi:hypothetical protein